MTAYRYQQNHLEDGILMLVFCKWQFVPENLLTSKYLEKNFLLISFSKLVSLESIVDTKKKSNIRDKISKRDSINVFSNRENLTK